MKCVVRDSRGSRDFLLTGTIQNIMGFFKDCREGTDLVRVTCKTSQVEWRPHVYQDKSTLELISKKNPFFSDKAMENSDAGFIISDTQVRRNVCSRLLMF